ncbi:MAG: hypothetical protein ACI97A_000286 [Planctomycetota bacterium]|jgi:hypothetical protein
MRRITFMILFCCFLPTASWGQEKKQVCGDIVLTASRKLEAAPESIRAGVPLYPSAIVKDVGKLVLVDAKGQPVVARLTPLARRSALLRDKDAAISWVELSFSASSKTRFPLRLVVGKRARGALSLIQTKNVITIAWQDKELVLDPASPSLMRTFAKKGVEQLAGPALRIFFSDIKKKDVMPGPWALKIEKQSSAAITLLASTKIEELYFELRIHITSGADDIVFDCRLVNRGPYGHMATRSEHAWFDRLSLSFPKLKGAKTVSADGKQFSGSEWALLQHHVTPYKDSLPSEKFPFQVWSQSKTKQSGERHSGCFALGSGSHSFAYGFVDFWENAPKAWSIHDEVVICDLFPAGGSGPKFNGRYGMPNKGGEVDPLTKENYRFEGSRAKSHRIFMNLNGGRPAISARRIKNLARIPVHVTVAPRFLQGQEILGYVVPPRPNSKSSAGRQFERFATLFIDDQAADNQPALGVIGLPRFIERGGTYGRSVFRGWFNHGDLAWGDGYCSLHYDLPFSVLFNFLRSGDPRFLALGQQMSRHRRDIDQDHDETSTSNRRGGQFYEKGWWHGNYYHPHASHTWVKGPLLHYLLTGDLWSLEAARLNRDFIRRATPEKWNGDWGTRIPGWNIENLLALHEVMGHKDDIRMAHDIAACWQAIETKRDGAQGFVKNIRMKPISWKPWMHNILFNGIALYRLRTGDKEFDPLLDRIANRFRNSVLKKAPGGPWRAARNMIGEQRDRPSVQLLWPMAASFSLLARIHERPQDVQLAHELFRDALLYFQEKPGAPVAFRIMNYPNSESKIHGGIQLWGLHALAAEQKRR